MRPVFQWPSYTPLLYALEASSIALWLGYCVYLGMVWETLPKTVPIHFNIWGEIDGMGPKSSLLILCGVGVGIWVSLTAVSFFPRTWNIPFRISEEGWPLAYRCIVRLYVVQKVVLGALFAMLTLCTIKNQNLPSGLGLILLVTLLGTIGFHLWELYRISKTTHQ